MIRDVREQVTRRVTDLMPGGRNGMKAQFQAAIGLRRVARTEAFVEYQDAVDSGLGRALGRSGGAWRAFTRLAASAASAGASGTAAAVAATTVVTVVTVGVLSQTGALKGDTGETGPTVTVPVTVDDHPHDLTNDPVLANHPHAPVTSDPVTTTQPQVGEEEREQKVVAGDTLWDITEDMCGKELPIRDHIDNMLEIWVANIDKIGRDPNSIDIDQVLIIPCPEQP